MNEQLSGGSELIRSASPEAERRTGYKKSARAEKILDGLLPDPISIGGRARAFLAYELEMVSVAWASGLNEAQVREVVKNLKASRGTNSVDVIIQEARKLISHLKAT